MVLVEDIAQCTAEHTYPKKVISFRQSTEDSIRLKCRKKKSRDQSFSWFLVSTLCKSYYPDLSPAFLLANGHTGGPHLHHTISIGGSSAPAYATFSLSPWMIPDLRDSANLHHTETLWTVWKGSR